jgi:hypothetical protein
MLKHKIIPKIIKNIIKPWKNMNKWVTWTLPLSFHIVIPSPSMLAIGCYFLSLFLPFFPFHFLFFPKLARPSMLSLWTFTLESLYKVYPHVFFFSFLPLFCSLISKGIYRGFLGLFWWIPLKTDQNLVLWSKWDCFEKMLTIETFVLQWFLGMMVLLMWFSLSWRQIHAFHTFWSWMKDLWPLIRTVTPYPTSRILSALAHGSHRFVLGSHAWLQNMSY